MIWIMKNYSGYENEMNHANKISIMADDSLPFNNARLPAAMILTNGDRDIHVRFYS